MAIRKQIINEARKYLGTPFHHQGRVKGSGVDCIGLVTGVAKILGLSDYDNTVYSRHPDGAMLMGELEKHLEQIPIENAVPGDILVFRIRKYPQHLALMTDVGMIHTNQKIGRVVENHLDARWKKRIYAAFKFPGVR